MRGLLYVRDCFYSNECFLICSKISESVLARRVPSPQLRQLASRLYNPYTTLWLLDGYDEALGRVPEHLQALLHLLLSSPNRILTGRHHAMTGVRCDVRVEVIGFNDDAVVEFVKRFSDSRAGCELILSSLRRQQQLWEMAHVPVNLVLLCHILCSGHWDTGSHHLTLTSVYSQVCVLLPRLCVRDCWIMCCVCVCALFRWKR